MQMSLLFEVLSSQKLEGSVELVSSIMELLNRVAQRTDLSGSESSYIEQLAMACIDSSASRVKVSRNFSFPTTS